MSISVIFLGLQRKLAQTDCVKVPFLKGMRVADVLEYIRERYPQLSLNEGEVLVTVNNGASLYDRILEPKDSVCFVSHLGGG